jgi:integral membrane protein (TIGR01906 family)
VDGSTLLPHLPGWLGLLQAVLFVLCVPLCLVANNVRWVTLDPSTYERGYEKYDAGGRTGLDAEQLRAVTRAFTEYFEGPPGELNPVVNLGGQTRPLFNEREVSHMEDVQQLMQLVFRLGWIAALYLVGFTVVTLVVYQLAALPLLGRLLLWGAGLSFALLISVAALSLVDFGTLFLRFHQVSFRNDLWMLDPRRDYLLMLFPQGFWLDVTLRIAALTAGEAFLLGMAGWLLARR